MTLYYLLFIAFVMLSLLYFAWRRTQSAERHALRQAVGLSATTLLVLLLIALLPIALLLHQPSHLPLWLLALPLLIWSVCVAAYWSAHVVPVTALMVAPLATGAPPRRDVAAPDDVEGSVVKQFHWQFRPRDGVIRPMQITLSLNMARYHAARAEPRRPIGDWAHYAALDMPELDTLTAAFQSLHADRSWSTLEQACNVLCFTQSCITYRSDEDTTPAAEWPRYPIETLLEEVGDCEDDVILAAAILKRLGFEVALLYYPGHCALGVAGAQGLPGDFVSDPRTNLDYFYGETTAAGWHLGQLPPAYRNLPSAGIEIVHRVVHGQP